MMRFLMGVAALLLAGGACAQGAEGLGWIAGDWVEVGEGRLSEESWLPPRVGELIGMSRSGRADRPGLFEFMRIAAGADGRLSLMAQPGGAPPSTFHLTEQTGSSITFTNASHDYPQRIRYWRDGELLMAEISLQDGSKLHRWRYQRRR